LIITLAQSLTGGSLGLLYSREHEEALDPRVIALVIWGCAHKMAHAPTSASTPDIPPPPTGCGLALTERLAHVYHPDRLVVIEREVSSSDGAL
jgi:hypothetical protein